MFLKCYYFRPSKKVKYSILNRFKGKLSHYESKKKTLHVVFKQASCSEAKTHETEPFRHVLKLIRWNRDPVYRSISVNLLKRMSVSFQIFQHLLKVKHKQELK